MTERRKGKTAGGRGAGRSPQLKPERVQARWIVAAPVELVCIVDYGTPDEEGMVNLELREPTEVRGFLVGPAGESEAASLRIEKLRLQVPMPPRQAPAEPGRRKRRSTAPSRRARRAPP